MLTASAFTDATRVEATIKATYIFKNDDVYELPTATGATATLIPGLNGDSDPMSFTTPSVYTGCATTDTNVLCWKVDHQPTSIATIVP